MPEIRYPHYRAYVEQRIDANNSIMAFLAGAQIARHTLTLVKGSQLLLPEVFPNIPHIKRFSLKPDLAIAVLEDAEAHLGSMAVPYIQAIHEDFVTTGALVLLAEAGLVSSNDVDSAKSATMHELVEEATGQAFGAEFLRVFHLIRHSRNSVIHAGGRASAALANASQSQPPTVDALWLGITGSSRPTYKKGDPVALTLDETIASFAVTKRLGRAVNGALEVSLPRATWADIVVEDVRSTRRFVGNDVQTMRLVGGTARHEYAALALNSSELEEAARRVGLVT